MKVRRHSWILIPLAAVLGLLLGRSGYVERTLNPLPRIATAVNNTWGWVRNAAYRINDSGTIRDYIATQNYLKSHTVRKLQLGAGGNDPEGWLNSDIAPTPKEIYLDATRPYPFPDGSFQYVFSEQVIEHLSWENGIAMLRECHRVLVPGGKVRAVTPNLRKLMQLVEGSIGPEQQQFIEAKLRYHGWPMTPIPAVYIFNGNAHEWGHKFLYDPAMLRKSLELAGFQRIIEYPVGQKTDPAFREAERWARNPGSDLWVINNWESMAFEATR